MKEQTLVTHYDQYKLNMLECTLAITIWFTVLYCMLYSMYQSAWLALIVSLPASLLSLRFERTRRIKKQKQLLLLQFKDLLASVSSSLSAGRSLENCFRVAEKDLLLLYPSVRFSIIRELKMIAFKLDNGETLENCLGSFALRANLQEISQFVEALQTCKRSGGDLLNVMRKTSQMLSDQIDVNNEISILIAQKKLEASIMMVAPFVFMQLMNVMAKDYMEKLYNGIGYILITMVFLLLLGCFWLINKMMNIRI